MTLTAEAPVVSTDETLDTTGLHEGVTALLKAAAPGFMATPTLAQVIAEATPDDAVPELVCAPPLGGGWCAPSEIILDPGGIICFAPFVAPAASTAEALFQAYRERISIPGSLHPAPRWHALLLAGSTERDLDLLAADLLDEAAQYIGRHGWVRKAWSTQYGSCAQGALIGTLDADGRAAPPGGHMTYYGLVAHAEMRLLARVNGHGKAPDGYPWISVPVWNDAQGRTAGEVCAAMTATAAELRLQHA